jgi:hypothetical protein
MSDRHIEAIDINPLHWAGDAASAAVGDAWKAAMTGLWSAALWILKLAFRIVDAFTTPDLSPSGPMGAVLPTTLWLGAALAVVMMFIQLTLALIRRDGQSLGRIFLGLGQFGLVWVGYLGIGAVLVTAAAGLTHGILQSMLHVRVMADFDFSETWPHTVADVTLATVLGVLSLLVVIPAAFFYIVIMLVREAALIILVATAPISAGGLVSDVGKVWFWKTLRWFFSCLLISPMAALLLGIGVRLSEGVISPPNANQFAHTSGNSVEDVMSLGNAINTAHAGMAIIGCIVIAIGAVCPLVLFRLLAFVEPGTASGAALRQSWSDAGGLSGIVSGGKPPIGGAAATQSADDGRSGGEAGAESQTQSRLASAMGTFGTGTQLVTSIANRAIDIGSDVLGQAGIGSPSYSLTPTDERSTRRGGGRVDAERGDGDSTERDGGDSSGDGGGGSPVAPVPPPSPAPGGGPNGAGAATVGGEDAAVAAAAI